VLPQTLEPTAIVGRVTAGLPGVLASLSGWSMTGKSTSRCRTDRR
jgi:hypothetical protein